MSEFSPRLFRILSVLFGLALFLPAIPFLGCGDEDPAPRPVILVPDDYPTIQAAVDAAQSGEHVVVQPGVYTHSEVRHIDEEHYPGGVRAALFMKDGVFVEGAGTEYGQVILRDTTDAPFTVGAVFASTGGNTVIHNLAFEEFSVGVLMTGDSGQIQYVRTSDCPVGIHAVRAVEPAVYFSLVVRSDLAGILSEDVSDGFYGGTIVRDCAVGISVTGAGVPGVQLNVLCRNDVGLYVAEDAAPTAWTNAIHFNRENGVLLESGANPTVVQNDIHGNGIDFEVGFYDTPLVQSVYAITNFWASVDTLDIMAHILDQVDDPSRGAVVEYQPASPVSRSGLEAEVQAFCGMESPQGDAAILRMLHRANEGRLALGKLESVN